MKQGRRDSQEEKREKRRKRGGTDAGRGEGRLPWVGPLTDGKEISGTNGPAVAQAEKCKTRTVGGRGGGGHCLLWRERKEGGSKIAAGGNSKPIPS